MKATVNRTELMKAAQACDRALSTKTTLPILSSMLLSVEAERLLIRGTDLELTMESAAGVRDVEVGQAAIPAETFLSLVKGLSGETVTFTLNEGDTSLLVKCGHSNYKIPVLPPTDYPPSPQVSPGKGFAVDGAALAAGLGRVLGAVATDDTRPNICGTKWEVEGETLRLIATDTHRLHVTTLPVTETSGNLEFVLGRRGSAELAKLLNSDLCTVTVDQNLLEVCSTWGIFTARLTEGQFPNWRRIMPTSLDRLVMVNREVFLAAVKRAGIVAEGNANRLKLALTEEGALAITAQSDEHGEADESVEVASKKGEFEEMAVNYRFMTSTLSAMGDETVYMKTSHPLSPILIHGAEREVFEAVVMPMQF